MTIESQPSWSPDSRVLLVSARDAGVSAIFAVQADGSGVVRLTNGSPGIR
jgi:Tol biopolymer transport system component